jgi:hypothetical protein
MNLKPKHIQPVLMAGIMAFLMTAFVTWMNLGFPQDYVSRWLHAFIVAWPLAVVAAYIAIPISARATGKVLRALGADR